MFKKHTPLKNKYEVQNIEKIEVIRLNEKSCEVTQKIRERDEKEKGK